MIEKRRRDRINRSLNILKQLIIDSKRYPISNYNKRFEKADILEITVKYLESLVLEERRIYQQGFDDYLDGEKLLQEKQGKIMSVNLSTLHAELNEIKNRMATSGGGDSDGHYSADEQQQQHYFNDHQHRSGSISGYQSDNNNIFSESTAMMMMMNNNQKSSGVIQHTRNYLENKPELSSAAAAAVTD
uniref:Transcription factor HES-2-like n=1 Tax=Dermatophagoides pteronyssinus TaxID=6956 RepID=A0A6P6Y2X3_DERPT|nr:transcription factor HES-2-like [Dermatophagoides pteronyssinus]